MTEPRHTQDCTDEALIQHVRQQASGEPPAALDAFILAAARRKAPAPAPSLRQRWLRACQRPRYQMAFATVAGVALMIGLVVRSPVPDAELPSPAAARHSASPEAFARAAPQALQAPAPPMAPQAEQMQIQADAANPSSAAPVAKLSKRAAVAPVVLEQALQEILRLREAGEDKAADEKLLALAKRFPQEDLPARLEALRRR